MQKEFSEDFFAGVLSVQSLYNTMFGVHMDGPCYK